MYLKELYNLYYITIKLICQANNLNKKIPLGALVDSTSGKMRWFFIHLGFLFMLIGCSPRIRGAPMCLGLYGFGMIGSPLWVQVRFI